MKIKVIGVIATVAICSLMMGGCASKRVNLVDKGLISVEQVPSKKNYYISSSHVYRDANDLIVSGKVRRRFNNGLYSRGHVDIAIFSPYGEILERISAYHTPKIIKRRHRAGGRKASFKVRIPDVPPQGSVVRIAYHYSAYLGENTFGCGENTAIKNP